MEFEVEFYKKENGKIPVLDLLLTLQPKMRAKVYSEIELLKMHGHDLREPYVKALKGNINKGIFELRIKFSSNISRIFYFCYMHNRFVLLNGYIKKSNKASENELDKARRYKLDYERRFKND